MRLEIGALGDREHLRLIDDAAGESGKVLRRLRAGAKRQSERDQREGARDGFRAAPSNSKTRSLELHHRRRLRAGRGGEFDQRLVGAEAVEAQITPGKVRSSVL